MALFQRILAATDFGDSSKGAVDLAVEMAIKYGSKLTVFHAYSVFVPVYPVALAPDPKPMADAAQAEMDRFVAGLRQRLPDVEGVVAHGSPHREILKKAEELKADLIVLGTHGYGGITRLLLGGEAEKVVRLASVPVLTVRSQS